MDATCRSVEAGVGGGSMVIALLRAGGLLAVVR